MPLSTRATHSGRQDDGAPLAPGVDVPVCLDDVRQRKSPVDDRADGTGPGELEEEGNVLRLGDRLPQPGERDPGTAAADPPRAEHLDDDRRARHGGQVDPARLQRPTAPPEGALSHGVEDDVVRPGVPGEVDRRVAVSYTHLTLP